MSASITELGTHRSVYYITDLGEDVIAEPSSLTSGIAVILPRYGVWRSGGDVVEVNDDLKYLQEKYNVPTSQVHVL